MEFQRQVIDAWRSHGPSAADQLSEATRLFEQLKKKAFASLPGAVAEDVRLPQENDSTPIRPKQH